MAICDIAPARRAPVLDAVRHNLKNEAVDELLVLGEADLSWLRESMDPLAGLLTDRLKVETVTTPPSFATLVAAGNRLLAAGAKAVAILNADISFSDPLDVARLHAGLDGLSREGGEDRVVFAITRREASARAGMLHKATWLVHGTLAAEAWVFRQPILSSRELFYASGQTNSDRVLAEDLLAAGYRLYNPCLDVTIRQHHGDCPEAGPEPVPEAVQKKTDAQAVLERNSAANEIKLSGYPWLPPVSTTWLTTGYHPAPLHTRHPAILMAAEGPDCPDASIRRLARIAEGDNRDGLLLCPDPLAFFEAHAEVLCAHPTVRLMPLTTSLADIRTALLRGAHDDFESLAFVNDISQVSPRLLAEVAGVLVATPEVRTCDPDVFGCTLVTSVFRSDDFMRGFINNSVALEGYDDLIDHVFLVAKLSETEVALLDGLMRGHANVVVIWNRTDPGLYNCWNLGIRIARRTYVSNANVDDLRDPAQVVTLMQDLEQHPEALVAATALNPFYDFPPDGTLPENREGWYRDRAGRFTMFDIGQVVGGPTTRLKPFNMPHCMPVWRRSLHARFGWFDEVRYGTYADWAFWLLVLSDGAFGWLNPEPLSFYFVNPTSHNRRGNDLEIQHKRVEDEFLPMFLAKPQGRPIYNARPTLQIERKLRLQGRDHRFGEHRNDFGRLIHALQLAERQDGEGVLFVPFLERYFVWGDSPGEALSAEPRPITQDWIGILHVPFDAPDWFGPHVSPENFMVGDIWTESRAHCRGIITLAADLEADLNVFDPDLPTLSVRHPVEMDAAMFDPAAYLARPCVVQVGDWLRKLHAIHRLRAPGHERIMLFKPSTSNFLKREIDVFGDQRDPGVDVRRMVPNDEYDALLSSSVVLCLLYATAANNAVIECIARATPILVNPLPAVVEYLGLDYPLYVCDEAEAAQLLRSPGRVIAGHEYLKRRRLEIDLSYAGFCRTIAASGFYADLPTGGG